MKITNLRRAYEIKNWFNNIIFLRLWPPSGAISASAKQKLNDWIASGAPETANSPGGTAPPGTPPVTPPGTPIQPCEDDRTDDVVTTGENTILDTQLNTSMRRDDDCPED